MTSLKLLTVFYVVGTIALTVLTLRSHYRARAGISSRLATHAVAVVIAVLAAFIALGGVRWLLFPSWPSLAVPGLVAAVILGALWSSSGRRITTADTH